MDLLLLFLWSGYCFFFPSQKLQEQFAENPLKLPFTSLRNGFWHPVPRESETGCLILIEIQCSLSLSGRDAMTSETGQARMNVDRMSKAPPRIQGQPTSGGSSMKLTSQIWQASTESCEEMAWTIFPSSAGTEHNYKALTRYNELVMTEHLRRPCSGLIMPEQHHWRTERKAEDLVWGFCQTQFERSLGTEYLPLLHTKAQIVFDVYKSVTVLACLHKVFLALLRLCWQYMNTEYFACNPFNTGSRFLQDVGYNEQNALSRVHLELLWLITILYATKSSIYASENTYIPSVIGRHLESLLTESLVWGLQLWKYRSTM